MIVYALIVRTSDGLALSASTDFTNENDPNIKEGKRYLKLLAKKCSRFSPKCLLSLSSHNVYLFSSAGISYLTLCKNTYPFMLAFSFLNELSKEFSENYRSNSINLARRPYTFIEFDNIIHVTRQRYNKPQSLTTRVDLTQLSHELKISPPQTIFKEQIEPINRNSYANGNLLKLSVGPPSKLEPLNFISICSMIGTLVLALIGFYRVIASIEATHYIENDAPDHLNGLLFTLKSIFQFAQIYLILIISRYRKLESWLSFIIVSILNFLSWQWTLNNSIQVFLTWLTACTIHYSTITRKFQPKLPNYTV